MNCHHCGVAVTAAALAAARFRARTPAAAGGAAPAAAAAPPIAAPAPAVALPAAAALGAAVPAAQNAYFCPNCNRLYCTAHALMLVVRNLCNACNQYSCYACRIGGITCPVCTLACLWCGLVVPALQRKCANCGSGVCQPCEVTVQPVVNPCACGRALCALCQPLAVGGRCLVCARDHELQTEAAVIVAAAYPQVPPYAQCSAQRGTRKAKDSILGGAPQPQELLKYGTDLLLCPRCHQSPNTHAVQTVDGTPFIIENAQSLHHITTLINRLAQADVPGNYMVGVLIIQDNIGNQRVLAARSGASLPQFAQTVNALDAPWALAPECVREEAKLTRLLDMNGRHIYPKPVRDPDCMVPGTCAAPKLIQNFITVRGVPAVPANWRIVAMSEAWYARAPLPNNGKTHGASYTSCETCQDTLVRMFCTANPVANAAALRADLQVKVTGLLNGVRDATLSINGRKELAKVWPAAAMPMPDSVNVLQVYNTFAGACPAGLRAQALQIRRLSVSGMLQGGGGIMHAYLKQLELMADLLEALADY